MNKNEMKKIAHLARIGISDHELDRLDVSSILEFSEQINRIDTSSIEPLSHPLDLEQRLRPDFSTEVNRRDELQRIAPSNIAAGLYLVPQVLDSE